MRRLYAVVKGRVQGVGYRAAVQKRVAMLGDVTGYVRNLPNGTVEVVAEAESDRLDIVMNIIREGSFWSSVDDVFAEYLDAKGDLSEFSIC